ncbi:MAG: V-type ATPase 116kDa subunit family protein [Candidatus Thorarchaeota archaeon]
MLPAKMSSFTAITLDTDMDSALRLIAHTGLVHFSDPKESGHNLPPNLESVEASERFYYLSNLLARTSTLISDMKVYRGGKIKDPLTVPEIPEESYWESIEKKLKSMEDEYGDLNRALEAAERKEDKTAKKEAKNQIKARSEEARGELLGWEELIKREHCLEETKTLFRKTERTYIMFGWIPTKKVKVLEDAIAQNKQVSISLEFKSHIDKPEHNHYPADVGPLEGEVAPEEPVVPPTKQTNPRFLRSFQNLTNAFGLANHREVDPAWFMALGFPIIFGLMFGDIGHGLLLFGFAMIGLIAKRRNVDAGEMVNYFIQGSGLIAVIALVSIFFGILYGEFLGIDITYLAFYQGLKYSPFGQGMKNILVNLFIFFDFDGGVNWFLDPHSPYNLWILGDPHGHPTPIWFSAFEMPADLPSNIANPTWILFVLSIIIGFIHLSIAIGFDAINKIRHRDWKHAIFGPIIWLYFLWGLAFMIFQFGINFMSWPIIEMILALILPALIMFLGGMIVFGFMDGFMEGLERLIESISNKAFEALLKVLAIPSATPEFSPSTWPTQVLPKPSSFLPA